MCCVYRWFAFSGLLNWLLIMFVGELLIACRFWVLVVGFCCLRLVWCLGCCLRGCVFGDLCFGFLGVLYCCVSCLLNLVKNGFIYFVCVLFVRFYFNWFVIRVHFVGCAGGNCCLQLWLLVSYLLLGLCL